MGPAVSWVSLSGTIPRRLTSPRVGRTPTRLLNAGGDRTDEQVSDPVPMVAKFAATPAAVPPLDPEGRRSSVDDQVDERPIDTRIGKSVRLCTPRPGDHDRRMEMLESSEVSTEEDQVAPPSVSLVELGHDLAIRRDDLKAPVQWIVWSEACVRRYQAKSVCGHR
jgi:hypothetical protein